MSRFVLWIAGVVALLSAAYLGFVKLAFAPDAEAPAVVVEAERPEPLVARPAAPVVSPAPARPPSTAPRPAAPPPPRPMPADTADAPPDTAAVRRLTVELAEQTRDVAHVGKTVAPHVATGVLGLGPDGCKTTGEVQLCLVPSSTGGWKIVGAAGGYAVTARGPAALGEPIAVTAN